jgi:hypothetical protein
MKGVIERISGIGVLEYFTDMSKLLELESENYVNRKPAKRQLSVTDSNTSDKLDLKSLITPFPSLLSLGDQDKEIEIEDHVVKNENLEKAINQINVTNVFASRQNSKQQKKFSFNTQKSISGKNVSKENDTNNSPYKRMSSKSSLSSSLENNQSLNYHQSIHSANNRNSSFKEFLLYFILVV